MNQLTAKVLPPKLCNLLVEDVAEWHWSIYYLNRRYISDKDSFGKKNFNLV
jgi:hypothetical protein